MPEDADHTLAYYERSAAAYAAAWGDHQPAALLALLDSLSAPSRILDVGCGTGRDLALIHRAGHHGVGLDPSGAMLAQARAAARRALLVTGSAVALPFPDRCFDVVLASASLLHLTLADTPRALAEIGRVLRPGGRTLITVKALPGPDEAWEGTDEHGRHLTLHSVAGLGRLLTGAGFAAISVQQEPDTRRAGLSWLLATATAPVVQPDEPPATPPSDGAAHEGTHDPIWQS